MKTEPMTAVASKCATPFDEPASRGLAAVDASSNCTIVPEWQGPQVVASLVLDSVFVDAFAGHES